MGRGWISSLRIHLTILALIAVVPVLAVQVYTGFEHRRSKAIEAQHDALRLARLASKNHEYLIEDTRRLLVILSHVPRITSEDSAACDELLAEVLKEQSIYTNIGIVKPDGSLTCSAVPANKSQNLGDRAPIHRALTSREFAIGDYAIGPITGKPAIGFGYPIINDTGEIKEVLFAALDLAWLNKFADESGLPSGSTVTVVDRNGTILMRYPDTEKWIGTSISEMAVGRSVLAQGEGITEGLSVDGVNRLFAFTPLSGIKQGLETYILVGIPVAVAYAPADRMLFYSILWFGLLTALALVAAWIGGNVLLFGKLNTLLAAARRLSAGYLNTRTRMTGGPKEIVELGNAFDEMAATLERRQGETAWAQQELQKALDESKRRRAEASALLEATRAVLDFPQFQDAIKTIFKSCHDLIGANGGKVCLLTEDGKVSEAIFFDAQSGYSVIRPPKPTPVQDPCEEVYRTGKALYRNEHVKDECELSIVDANIVLSNILIVPLTIMGKTLGMLCLVNKPRGFNENDVKVASVFGEIAAIALNNSRTLESLESSEERFRTVAHHAGDAILTVDSEGNVVFWNQAAENAYGYSADEVIGKPIFNLIPEREKPAVAGSVARLSSPEMQNAVEMPFEGFGLKKDGTEFPVEISLSFWKTEEGNFLTAILRDITERKQAEEMFRTLSNNSPIGIHIIQNGKFQFVNPQFQKDTGYSEEELLGKDSMDLILPEDRAVVRSSAVEMLKGKLLTPFEYRIVTRSGETKWVMETVTSIQYKGSRAVLANFMDITERKKAEEAVARSHDFYLTLFDGLPNPIRRSGVDGKCDYYNKAWLSFRGRTFEQEIGDGWKEGVHPEDLAKSDQAYWEAFKERKPVEVEFRLRRYDGEYRWILEIARPFNDLDGNFAGYIGSSYDITERKQQEQQLAYLATHDPLTGLPNRRSLEDAMKRVVARARRGVHSALLFLDVDNFKLVNDTLGHTVGDRALITLTRVLQEQLRSEDLLARLGGDEFAVLLEGTNIDDARVVAERMRRAIDEFAVTLDGLSFNLSLSMGLVAIDGQDAPAMVLSQADAAMYRAKEQGRNRIVVYQQEEDDLAWLSQANRLAIRLKDALKENEFILCYQPVVRLSDGHIEYYEALIRLQGDDGRIISAGDFIAAAERFGLMPQLTRWIVKEVILTLREYPQIRISVNLSGLDLADESLPEFIERCLEECDVDPTRLCFEITETAIIKDLAQADRWMRRLRAIGCHFALDDFGTGYLSFVHLRSLPVDHLKIDGSLIKALDTDPAQRALIQAIQTLAGMQGQETIAEWVESESVTQVLRDIGVNCVQGYYLGKPNPDFPLPRVQASPEKAGTGNLD